MRTLIFLSSCIFLFACSPNKTQQDVEIDFKGSLALAPLESAPLCFDRLAELQESQAKKDSILNIYKSFEFDKNPSLTADFPSTNKKGVEKFIDQNRDKLILNEDDRLIWKETQPQTQLLLINNKKELDISSLVQNLTKDSLQTTITFSPNAQEVLSGFSMKYLNRPIVLLHNSEVLAVVKNFGKLENGKLVIASAKK